MTAEIHAITLREGNTHKYGFCCEISLKQRLVFFLHLQLIGQKTFQQKKKTPDLTSLSSSPAFLHYTNRSKRPGVNREGRGFGRCLRWLATEYGV